MRERRASQSIDRDPVKGADRKSYEHRLLDDPRIKRVNRAVLKEILDSWLCGKADCYPSVRKISKVTGFSTASVSRALEFHESIDVFVRAIDRSILPTQRRI